MSAGGVIAYQYEALPAAGRTDLNTPVSQTNVIDRNSNRTEYRFAPSGNPVRVRELANRDVRAVWTHRREREIAHPPALDVE